MISIYFLRKYGIIKKERKDVRKMFCHKLSEYIDILGCSGKEFAEQSGISEATVSRYKSGARTPKVNSEDMKKLCRGICSIADQKGIDMSYKTVLQELNSLAAITPFDYDSLQTKFNMLCSVFSVNLADMSKSLKYDSSYISRIKNGKRRPADPQKFAFDVAEYFSGRCDADSDKKIIAKIMNIKPGHIKTRDAYISEITNWLTDNKLTKKPENPVKKFLDALDTFNLNEYIKAIRFDKIKVPSLPFQIPTSKNYYGIDEMKNGELDFLKATALSKSKHSVFMHSDMQMDDMAADMDFSKKYMFGLAVMLKKGLHLNVVHNLNRPFNELMLGFECWIPLYMTGQISPYYLKGTHNQIFCHFLNVSGAAALSGECISGSHTKGKYYLTKNKDELAYYQERAVCILKKAHPLMDIYREDKSAELSAFLLANSHTGGNRRNILSTLSIYTATDEFLGNFLDNRNVSNDEKQKILDYAATRREQILEILKNNSVSDEIPYLSEDTFKEHPHALSLSLMFCDKNFEYTYEEYIEHCRLTEEFARLNKNYSVVQTEENAFVNIQITIHENEYVMISKNKAPTIHFVLRHPILREAIENLDFPVFELSK